MAMILPQVEATAVPLQQFEAPRSENVAAEQGVQQGQAMMKAGSALTKIAQDLQDEIDTATTKEYDNKLADVVRGALYDPEKGYLATSGKNALTARAGVVKGIDDAIREIEPQLWSLGQPGFKERLAALKSRIARKSPD